MKKFLFIMMLSAYVHSYSQAGFEKLPKGACTVDHKCSTTYNYDSFEKIMQYSAKSGSSSIAKKGMLTYSITRLVDKDKHSLSYITFMVQRRGCVSQDSYVHVVFKDGEDIKLPNMSKRVDCGTNAVSVNIQQYIDVFQTKAIDKVRVVLDFEENFDLSDKGSEAFLKNIQCITSAEVSQ